MAKSRRHILLVEGHGEIRTAFAGLFEEIYGYALHVADGARDASGITGRHNIDLAVVDLAHGAEQTARLEMISAWRRDGLRFPVIATSPRDHDGLMLDTFAAGGDDFLRKPYLFSELRARIERHLERHLGYTSKTTRIDGIALPSEPFDFGGATITPDLRITFPNGQRFKLGVKQLGILREFNLHVGTLLTKERLLRAVWGADANPNSMSVHQYLHMLRKLYRASSVDLNEFVTAENKVGWRIAAQKNRSVSTG